MKKIYLKAILVLIISILTLSCKEDPIPEIPSNYLKYNGKYYELTNGYLTDFLVEKYNNTYHVILTGPTIKYDPELKKLYGCDIGVLMTIVLPYNSTTITTTNFVHYSSNIKGGYYFYLGFDPYCIFSDDAYMSFVDQKNDTLTINKSGFGYEILYSGYDQYSIPFELKYNGAIIFKKIFLYL